MTRSRVSDGAHVLPFTTQNVPSGNPCGNPDVFDAVTRLRWRSYSPGALIGSSGEISELPRARRARTRQRNLSPEVPNLITTKIDEYCEFGGNQT